MPKLRGAVSVAAAAGAGFALAVMLGAQGQGGAAAQPPNAGTPADAQHARWRRQAVLAPRDAFAFKTFFNDGVGSDLARFRVVAAFPSGTDQVYVILEAPQN
jgi:hypothetical protein